MTKIGNLPPPPPIDLKESRASDTDAQAANPAPPAPSTPSPAYERPSVNTARRARARIQPGSPDSAPAAHSTAQASSQPVSHPVSRPGSRSPSPPGTDGAAPPRASPIPRSARGAHEQKERAAQASSTVQPAGSRKSSQASLQAGDPYDLDDILASEGTSAEAPHVRQPNMGRSAISRIIARYEKDSSPVQHSGAARHQTNATPKQELMARIDRLLGQPGEIRMQWEPNFDPLPGAPDIAWDTIKPTGDLLGEGGFGCVVGLQAKRNGPVSGNDQEQHVRLAAKFIFDEHGMPGQATGKTGTTDKLREELAIYRQVIGAQAEGKTLGLHPNLCEIYGIVSMTVDGAEMRALLMEAVPGHNAQKTADILRHCLDANYLSPREYWGAIQYLCDRTLDAAERLRQAGVVHRDLKQDNILVRADGAVKVIDYGLATGPGDMRFRGTPDYMSKDHLDESGVSAASDVFAIGASAAEMAEGYRRKFSPTANGEFNEVLPKDGAMKGFIQRDDAQGRTVTTPVNQMSSAYSNFINSVLRKTGTQKPVMPDEAKRMDFINDPMMGHEEAQAVIRAAFALAEIEGNRRAEAPWEPRIEGNRRAGAPWEPRPDARSSALRLIEREQAQKPEEGKLHSARDESILTPRSLPLFLENPNLENYISLKQHYLTARDQDKIIGEVLKSMPPAQLQSLNDELSSSFISRGQALYQNRKWINDFNAEHQSGRNKSLSDLRSYIDEASKLFKELQAASHELTPVDWSKFNELGALTKTALGLMRNATGHDKVQQSIVAREKQNS